MSASNIPEGYRDDGREDYQEPAPRFEPLHEFDEVDEIIARAYGKGGCKSCRE